MKRILQKSSNEGCASPPGCLTRLIPLSVSCVSSASPIAVQIAVGSVLTGSNIIKAIVIKEKKKKEKSWGCSLLVVFA
jgi:hypothetical protein